MTTTIFGLEVKFADEISIGDCAYRITNVCSNGIFGTMIAEHGQFVKSNRIYPLDLRLPGWHIIQLGVGSNDRCKPGNPSDAVATAQKEFSEAGYQWVERVFNDNNSKDCLITLTKFTDPCALLGGHPEPDDTVGWGRYTRENAWSMALKWLRKQK